MKSSFKNSFLSLILFCALLGAGVACAPAPTATPVPSPTIARPAQPTATPSPTVALSVAAPSESPTRASVPPPTILPAPTRLSDLAQDKSIFLKGLIKAEHATLDRLAGATVYTIDVQIADDLLSLKGQQHVRYTNREDKPLSEIYFQLFPNAAGGKSTLSAISVDGQAVNPAYEFKESAARIPLPAPLQPGKQVVIQMDFDVQVATKMEINYGLFGYFEGVLVLDSFYPVIPVYDHTGWNVQYPPPNADTSFFDASFYVVRVSAPEKLVVVASGIRVDQQREGNRQVVTFAAGPARDFYLAASERFVVVSDTIGETTINSYAFAERKPGVQSALKIAKDALGVFNARLGEYPYTELDVVSTPMLALGIEYPGIIGITLREYDPNEKISGLPSQVYLESTVAHEIVHQWYYNVIGNDQIDEPWLDESLTQYVTGLYYMDLYGESGAQTYRNNNWAARWNRLNRAQIPIGLPAAEYKANEYSPIVYGRGPYFVQALAEKMGPAAFDKFLRDYNQTHKWDIGTTASFKQIAERNCQCDLTALFDEWVYRK